MLVHPLFRALISQPEVLVDHAGAYAELASAEVSVVMRQWQRRLMLQVLALGLLVIGVGLGGMALMWLGARGTHDMPAPWALALVPIGFIAAAGVVAWCQARLHISVDLAALREQWALDQGLWREIAQS